MALTNELLKANQALAGLTDEQITAIVTLSANDENSVISKRIGEIYGGLDADILEASGISKNGTEKTFDYAKRVVGELKSKVAGSAEFEKQIEALKKEKAKLEKAISEGATDAETAKQLKQAKADLTAVQTQFNDLKTKYEEAESKFEQEIFGVRIESELSKATTGIKFKNGIPESATQVLLNQAIDKIKSMKPEYIDDGKGGKALVFKDETGAIMRNPNNQLNPYTPGDLLTRELVAMDILDNGRQLPGGGTTPPTKNTGSSSSLDISGAKSRVEAYDIIANVLIEQGAKPGTEKFDVGMKQAWQDNNISSLPEK